MIAERLERFIATLAAAALVWNSAAPQALAALIPRVPATTFRLTPLSGPRFRFLPGAAQGPSDHSGPGTPLELGLPADTQALEKIPARSPSREPGKTPRADADSTANPDRPLSKSIPAALNEAEGTPATKGNPSQAVSDNSPPIESLPQNGARRFDGHAPSSAGDPPQPAVEEGNSRLPASLALPEENQESDPALKKPAPPPGSNDSSQGGERTPKLPRSLWALFWGFSVVVGLGSSLGDLSQPFLVSQTLGMSALAMGVLRNVQLGAMAAVNFLPAGSLVDKTDFKVLFISILAARAALAMAIPILFFPGHLGFIAYVAVMAAGSLFKGLQATAFGAATNAFVGTDPRLNKEAAAAMGKYSSLTGMIFPIIAGTLVGAMVHALGNAAYPVAYGLYGLLFLAAIPVIYFVMGKDRRKNVEIKTFSAFASAGLKMATDWTRGLPRALKRLFLSAAEKIRRIRQNKPAVRSSEAMGFWERSRRWAQERPSTQGLRHVLKNRVLSAFLYSESITSFLNDAMPMVVFPIFITQMLTPPAHLPAVVDAVFGTTGGIFGLMLAVESLGYFTSAWLMQGSRGDRLIHRLKISGLYRISGLGAGLFWLIWIFPTILFPGAFWINLAVILAAQFLIAATEAPVPLAMAPLVRREMPEHLLGQISGAFFTTGLLFSAAGGLVMGLALNFGVGPTMLLAAVCATIGGIVDWMVPRWLSLEEPPKRPGGSASKDRLAGLGPGEFSYA